MKDRKADIQDGIIISLGKTLQDKYKVITGNSQEIQKALNELEGYKLLQNIFLEPLLMLGFYQILMVREFYLILLELHYQ